MARPRKIKVSADNRITKRGRPSRYTPELAERFCRAIATSSKGIRAICKELGLRHSMVYEWLSQHEDFQARYARAKEFQCQVLFDQIVEIADTPVLGTVTKRFPNGKTETRTGDMVDRSRLSVDARKWALSKLLPKKYGDFERLEHTGTNGGAVEYTHTISFAEGNEPKVITASVIAPQGESKESLLSGVGVKPEKEAPETQEAETQDALAPWKLLRMPITNKII